MSGLTTQTLPLIGVALEPRDFALTLYELSTDETLNIAKNLKKKLEYQIKKIYGTKAKDLLKSLQFILDREF